MSAIDVKRKGHEFQTGDVIEVSMNIEPQIPPEDDEKLEIDLNDYAIRYNITYRYPKNMGFADIDFTVEAGCYTGFGDDIKNYIEESIELDLEEIAEYELFDVDNTGEYQTAKIRIKALKEV